MRAQAPSAAAERVDAGVHLSWVRAESARECGNAGLVQADVVRRLRKNPFTEPSRVFVEASVTRAGTAFQAQLELRDEQGQPLGTRRVTSDAASCDSLVSAAALAIALMIDPDAVLAPPEPAKAPPPASATPPSTTAVPSATALPEPRARGGLLAAVVGSSRVLPRAALGMRVAVEVLPLRRFGAELSLTFLPEVRQGLRGFDVSFGLTYASLGLCYRLLSAPTVELGACALGSAGALHATAFEPARGVRGQLFWSAAGAGLRAAWQLTPPVLLRAGVEASLPLERRDYLMRRGVRDEAEEVAVFSDPSFSATVHVGLGVRF